jgi:hypothetical protein
MSWSTVHIIIPALAVAVSRYPRCPAVMLERNLMHVFAWFIVGTLKVAMTDSIITPFPIHLLRLLLALHSADRIIQYRLITRYYLQQIEKRGHPKGERPMS